MSCVDGQDCNDISLVIYGAGKRGKEYYRLLHLLNVEVVAFCDKKYYDIRIVEKNVPVLSYEECSNMIKPVFLVSPKASEVIIEQLESDCLEYYLTVEDFVLQYYSSNEEVLKFFSHETFPICDANLLLMDIYNKYDNYEISEYDDHKSVVYVFFSSNGIYYPDEIGEFNRIILLENKYEWKKLVKDSSIPNIAAKCIFIRDVLKSWYVNGINNKYNSIDHLAGLLRELTRGYKVITVGVSSGGYAAVILGALIGASKAFSFSGQFSLSIHDNVINTNPFIKSNRFDYKKRQYYDIGDHIDNNIEVIYYYPKYSIQDQEQANYIKSFKKENIQIIEIESSVHGAVLEYDELKRVLTDIV